MKNGTRRYLWLAAFSPLVFLLSLKAEVPAEDALITIEKGLWEAWKNHETAPFQGHLHPDFVSVSETGSVAGRRQTVSRIGSTACDVSSYSLSDWRFFSLGGDAAMLLYRARVDATCNGDRVPSRLLVSSVYVLEQGRWQMAAYQETRLK